MDDIVCLTQNLSIGPEPTFLLNDTFTDVVVHADDDVSIRAHKSVLVGCPYFSAMLQGDWIENQTSSIKITGYSSNTLMFVINYLYEPEIKIKDDEDLSEILALSDMLGLLALVEKVINRIVQTKCHNFHKACPECIPGVLSCLQLATRFNLMELEIRCISWISKHFTKVWNSRPFANLPKVFHAKCQEHLLATININTVMNLLLESQQIKDTLPSVKWTEPISFMIQQLREKLTEYLQQNFSDAFETSWFQNLRECDEWHVKCVQQQLQDASGSLPIEQACRAYIKMDHLIENNWLVEEGNREAAQYLQFLKNVHKAVENRLIQRVAMATKCPSWKDLPEAKQIAIMQLGFFSPLENSPQANRAATRSANTPTTIRRHESLHEPRRPTRLEVNQAQQTSQSANRPPRGIERNAHNQQGDFQRNVLRSTAPRLRNVSQRSSVRNGTPNSSLTSASNTLVARPGSSQRSPASTRRVRTPQPAWR